MVECVGQLPQNCGEAVQSTIMDCAVAIVPGRKNEEVGGRGKRFRHEKWETPKRANTGRTSRTQRSSPATRQDLHVITRKNSDDGV